MARPLRYTFILGLVGAGTVLAAVGGWRFARASAPVSGPIVLISVDSLRADRLPIYGYQDIETPAIDALAADGVVFERAYSHAPSTLASHAALMTGRLPFRTGVRGEAGFTIDQEETLLAEILRDRAYATAGVVSSFALRRETGIAQGFAFFDDGALPGPWSGRRDELQRDGAESQAIAEQWLESADTERAFLFLHLNDAQRPHRPADSREQPSYDAGVIYADQVVGDMIEYLKSRQLYDQSTVILLSDHGEGLGDHGEQGHGLLLHDETQRVPLVIKPAAGEERGRRVSDVVQLVDVLPTVVDLAKAPLPDSLDGESLAPLLDGSGALPDRVAYAEALYGLHHLGWNAIRAITDGRYRFIAGDGEELYDLDSDPAEQRNIADLDAAIAERFRAALQSLTEGDTIPAPALVSGGVRAKLAALGFVGWPGEAAGTSLLVAPPDRVAFVEAYRRAVGLFADGHRAAGLPLLERLAKSQPSAVHLWRDLAGMASAAGRYDLAFEAYRHVVTLDPDATDAAVAAAAAAFELRRFAEATRRANAVLASLPDETGEVAAQAHELLARIALARRDPALARAHALQGQNADPGRPLVAWVEGRILLGRNRFPEALAAFEEAIEAVRDSPVHIADLYTHAAESAAGAGRLEEATRLYEAELALRPESAGARAGLAEIYHRDGRPEAAAAVLAGLLQFTPTPGAYSLAARLWTSFGEPSRAAAVRAEAARLFTGGAAPSAEHQ